MNKIFFTFAIILFIVSCEKPVKEAETKKTLKNDKFEVQYTQKDADDFKVYILNTYNGNVFIRLNNGACYLAENKLPKAEYDVPSYSFKIMTGNEGYDQIVLLDKLTGEVQIMTYSNTWYVATNEVIQ
jgi:hypothetical protein